MTFRQTVRFIRREARGERGRITFFVGCLAIGVAAVSAVAGLSLALDRGIRAEARKLLAADIAVSGHRPLTAEVDAAIDGLIAQGGGRVKRADIKELATIVASPAGKSQLVKLKVVDGGYPFYGKLGVDPDRPLAELLAASRSGAAGVDVADGPGGVVVAPDLLSHLGLSKGDTLKIGGVDFRIAGVVSSEPDRISMSFTLGPRVFISGAGLERAHLDRLGSHIEYRTLVAAGDTADAEEIDAIKKRIESALAGDTAYKLETYADAQPELRSGLKRAGRFLGLVALLSLLIGGIGVAQTVRSWIAGRMDSIAILKCLGMRPREILALYLGQTLLLGAIGSLVGCALGALVVRLVPLFIGNLLTNVEIDAVQPVAILRGVVLGIGIAVLFSIPPLTVLRRVAPLRVMRREAEPLPAGRIAAALTGGVLIAGIFVTAWVQSDSVALGGGFTLGIVVAVLALALAAFATSRIVASARRLPARSTRIWLRHGLTALARPGAGTLGAIVALGLGVLVVLAMFLVHDRLIEEFRADLPESSPTAFVVDIQPDQWDGVRAILEKENAKNIDSVPVVNARLLSIEGRPVEDLAKSVPDEGRKRWVLTREQNITYLPDLPKGNKIVAGKLWSDPAHGEISIEDDFAKDLGVGLGSKLTFNVQGLPVELVVTSLRKVDWRTFGINFFLIVEPGVLEGAPQSRVAAARLVENNDPKASEKEQRIQDELAASFPNVTVLKIREIIDKIVTILDRLGLGIRVLGSFTVFAGIAILAGAISAGSIRRGREVALLKTLGMTRRGVALVFSVEYALIGAVAAGIGVVGGGVLAWVVLTRGMEIEWQFRPAPFAVAFAGTIALSVVAGLAVSVRALSRRPIEVLRGE